jgi:hypothetical protein
LNTDRQIVKHIALLRVAVGFLGEQSSHKWWNCSFFDASGKTFLAPVFPRTHVRAQYQGVVSAAALVHDEHIGVGNVFHLFRLPEYFEQDIHVAFDADIIDAIANLAKDTVSAMQFLSGYASKDKKASPGPVKVGKLSLMRDSSIWKQITSLYLSSFEQKLNTYPFFSDNE